MDVGYYQDRSQRELRQSVQDRWMDAYAPVRHLDPVVVAVAVGLATVGIVMIYSAKLNTLELQDLPTTYYASRQLIALGLGLVAMVVAAVVDYRHLRSYSAVVYAGSLLLLVAVLTPLGTSVNGAQSWVRLPGFQFQPSEVAKLGLIVALAALLHERKGDPGPATVLVGLVLLALPAALVLVQPDLGTTVVLVWVAFVLLLVGGVQARYLVGLALAGAGAFVVALRLELIQAYQLQRLTAFLNADDVGLARDSMFHLRQSLIAIGSGELAGKGLFEGTQTRLSYVPENHTDFIFTVIGEEFGFLGAATVLGLFALLLWRGLRIALMAKDLFGTLLAAGIVAVLTAQIFVNVGMTIGLAPVTGLPLPFVSYGGTSLILHFVFVGLLLNIHMRRF